MRSVMVGAAAIIGGWTLLIGHLGADGGSAGVVVAGLALILAGLWAFVLGSMPRRASRAGERAGGRDPGR